MTLRPDLAVIAESIPVGSRVLDVGCGDGALMAELVRTKRVDARGLELSREGVSQAVARGLSVIQGDADTDLADYPAEAFDVVVLSQTLQATHRPVEVLEHLLRIGRRAIVSFPNFGHWSVRLSLALRGRMPMTKSLPVFWYETANIHLCTILDFELLCAERGYRIERAYYLSNGHRLGRFGANLLAEQGVFILTRA